MPDSVMEINMLAKEKKLLLKMPQAKLSALLFAARDSLTEIRMLYPPDAQPVALVPNPEVTEEKPWTLMVMSTADVVGTRKHLGWAYITRKDIYQFYSRDGRLLRAIKKADMPASVTGEVVPSAAKFKVAEAPKARRNSLMATPGSTDTRLAALLAVSKQASLPSAPGEQPAAPGEEPKEEESSDEEDDPFSSSEE